MKYLNVFIKRFSVEFLQWFLVFANLTHSVCILKNIPTFSALLHTRRWARLRWAFARLSAGNLLLGMPWKEKGEGGGLYEKRLKRECRVKSSQHPRCVPARLRRGPPFAANSSRSCIEENTALPAGDRSSDTRYCHVLHAVRHQKKRARSPVPQRGIPFDVPVETIAKIMA